MKPKSKKTEIRKRKKRTLLKGSVKNVLENYFHQQPKPSLKEITWLAGAVQTDKEVVRIWFSNRRNKEKHNRPPPMASVRRTRAAFRIPATVEGTDGSTDKMKDLVNPVVDLTDELIAESNDATSYDLPRLVSVTSLADNSMDSGSTSDSNDMPQIIPNSMTDSTLSFDIVPTTSKAYHGGISNSINLPGRLSHRSSKGDGTLRVPETIRERSTRIGNCNGIDLYAIPSMKSTDPFSTFQGYVCGKPEGLPEQRTILIFGGDESGQMKFIDGMINYIFNIKQEDKFRFQLTEQETSQTKPIKVYKIHHAKGFRIPFSITIVSMPTCNANDAELFVEQETAKIFLDFLKNKDGIQGLDMICDVVNGTGVNRSFLTIFGNDVNGLVSSWQPSSYMDYTCTWHETMQNLFASLAAKKTRSLLMTIQVLEERKQMEAVVKGMQRLVKIGSCKMEEIDKAKQMIVFCQMQIESNDESEENLESTRKVELPAGQYVNNCNYCRVTCHDSFVEPLELKYENEGDCSSSSDHFEGTVTGFCLLCPEKCNLNMHSNQSYRWVHVKEERGRCSNPMDRRNETEIKWNDIKSKGRDLVKQLQKELAENGTTLLEHFQATWRCIQRINEIALRRNSFLTQEVFDCLFDAEQQLKQLGFDEGLESLRH